jgi:hypothetical protein
LVLAETELQQLTTKVNFEDLERKPALTLTEKEAKMGATGRN